MAIGCVELPSIYKEHRVVKAEWGTKLTCQSCGAKFYDLKKKPAVCPKCDTEQQPEKPKLKRATPPADPKPKAPEAEKPKESEDAEDDDDDLELDDDADDALLGDDDDDDDDDVAVDVPIPTGDDEDKV